MSRRHKHSAVALYQHGDDVADMVRELVSPIVHREHYQIQVPAADGSTTSMGRYHSTTHPPLLDQLSHALAASAAVEAGAGPRPTYQSKPAARLEALDALVRIDSAATELVSKLGGTPAQDVKANVRLVRDLAAGVDGQVRAQINAEVRSWWAQARCLTGWESPPWRPDSTCPLCGRRGGLRVRLDSQTAVRVECGEAWTHGTIGLLADHIRGESDAAPRRAS